MNPLLSRASPLFTVLPSYNEGRRLPDGPMSGGGCADIRNSTEHFLNLRPKGRGVSPPPTCFKCWSPQHQLALRHSASTMQPLRFSPRCSIVAEGSDKMESRLKLRRDVGVAGAAVDVGLTVVPGARDGAHLRVAWRVGSYLGELGCLPVLVEVVRR